MLVGEERDQDEDDVDRDAGQRERIVPGHAAAKRARRADRLRGDRAPRGGMRLSRRCMRDPRIEHAVEHVGDEVHRDDHQRDQEEGALRQRVVVRLHGADQQPPEPRPAEDRLDHDVAAERSRCRG